MPARVDSTTNLPAPCQEDMHGGLDKAILAAVAVLTLDYVAELRCDLCGDAIPCGGYFHLAACSERYVFCEACCAGQEEHTVGVVRYMRIPALPFTHRNGEAS